MATMESKKERASDLGDTGRLVEACILALDQIRTGAWHFRDRYDDEPAADALRRFADFIAYHVEDMAIEVAYRCERLDGVPVKEGGA